MIRLSDIRPRSVRWLWRPYVPLGAVTILEGDPGIGKSWVALDLAARVSSDDGRTPVNGRVMPHGACLYVTAEDDIPSVILPRVKALGGNLDNIVVSDDIRDVSAIVELASSIGNLKLIVLDPIQAMMGLYSISRLRSAMDQLRSIPGDPAIIIIRHFTKSRGRSVARGLGTIDFSASVRSILTVGRVVDYPDVRIVAHAKSSYGPAGQSMSYRLVDNRIEWVGYVPVTAADVGFESTTEQVSALREAMEFLETVLSSGPMPAAQVKKEAGELGISTSTLKRARKKLGIVAYRMADRWYLRKEG